MIIKSTKGVDNPISGEKDYRIITVCGNEFYCQREGKKWTCRGQQFKNVKDIKQAILEDAFGDNQAPGAEPAANVEPDSKTTPTWDCIDPCAHLVLLFELHDIKPAGHHLDTLDKLGWLVDGKPDVARAKRAVVAHNKAKQPDLSFI